MFRYRRHLQCAYLYGKPRDANAAAAMLRLLFERVHQVFQPIEIAIL